MREGRNYQANTIKALQTLNAVARRIVYLAFVHQIGEEPKVVESDNIGLILMTLLPYLWCRPIASDFIGMNTQYIPSSLNYNTPF